MCLLKLKFMQKIHKRVNVPILESVNFAPKNDPVTPFLAQKDFFLSG